MCGVAGIYSINNDVKSYIPQLRAMVDVLHHRGPDEEGFFVEGKIALAHKRLKIIDLIGGTQPLFNEEGSVVLVFNGEIYNYKALRVELEAEGHKFKTKTDSEVLVHLYEDDGINCVERLNGMFAFALWDNKTESLYLVRDRLGQKPIYYADLGGFIIFASEMKAFSKDVFPRLSLNTDAVYDYFSLGYIPAPKTIFKQVKKVEPSEIVSICRGSVTKSHYWGIDYNNKLEISYEDAQKKFLELFHDSIDIRMMSDVPIGAFLSGGIDSSAIVSIMSKLSNKSIKTFSVSFENSSFDESSFAKQIADLYKTDHTVFNVNPNFLDCVDDFIWSLDQPFADSSSLALYLISKVASDHVTVALAGDGGDESFGGYERYFAACLYDNIKNGAIPAGSLLLKGLYHILAKLPDGNNSKSMIIKMKRFLSAFESNDKSFALTYSDWFPNFSSDSIGNLFTSRFDVRNNRNYLDELFTIIDSKEFVDRVLALDMKSYLPDDLLHKSDSMSMAHSLELRAPFLDYRLVGFSASLPSKMKVALKGKRLLRDAFKGKLPKNILSRPKMGFGVPVGNWFKGPSLEYVKSVLFGDALKERAIVNPNYIRTLLDQHCSGKIDHSSRLWSALVFELWCRKFLDGEKL